MKLVETDDFRNIYVQKKIEAKMPVFKIRIEFYANEHIFTFTPEQFKKIREKINNVKGS